MYVRVEEASGEDHVLVVCDGEVRPSARNLGEISKVRNRARLLVYDEQAVQDEARRVLIADDERVVHEVEERGAESIFLSCEGALDHRYRREPIPNAPAKAAGRALASARTMVIPNMLLQLFQISIREKNA